MVKTQVERGQEICCFFLYVFWSLIQVYLWFFGSNILPWCLLLPNLPAGGWENHLKLLHSYFMSSIMETQPECAVINIPNIKTEQHVSVSPKKKNGGGMRFLRVALFKMRGRSAKPTALQVDNNEDGERSKSTWGKFVGSMRPLHLQSTQSPRSSI